MTIVEKYYPHDNHIFIFDNATTHLKWPDAALSARKMTKGPNNNSGVKVNVVLDKKFSTNQMANHKNTLFAWDLENLQMAARSPFMMN